MVAGVGGWSEVGTYTQEIHSGYFSWWTPMPSSMFFIILEVNGVFEIQRLWSGLAVSITMEALCIECVRLDGNVFPSQLTFLQSRNARSLLSITNNITSKS